MRAAPDDVERDRVRAGGVVGVGDRLPQRARAGVGGGRHRERRGPRSGGRSDSESQGDPQGTSAHIDLLGVGGGVYRTTGERRPLKVEI